MTLTAENFRGLRMERPAAGAVDGPGKNLQVSAGGPGDWMIANHTIDAAGRKQDVLPSWVFACGGTPPNAAGTLTPERVAARDACLVRFRDEGYRQVVSYHPASRFWALQLRESHFFVVLSLLLGGFCFWRIRRDLS